MCSACPGGLHRLSHSIFTLPPFSRAFALCPFLAPQQLPRSLYVPLLTCQCSLLFHKLVHAPCRHTELPPLSDPAQFHSPSALSIGLTHALLIRPCLNCLPSN